MLSIFSYIEHALYASTALGNILGVSQLPGYLPDEDGDLQFESGDSDTGGTWGEDSPTDFGAYVGTVTMTTASLEQVILPVFEAISGIRVFNPGPDPVLFPDVLPTINTGAVFGFCFAPGTAIATPDGEVPVEALRIGTHILGADGRATVVDWIGRQTLHPGLSGHAPVRVAAGALGGGRPHSDLIVTADHGLLIDGTIVQAGALIGAPGIAAAPKGLLPSTVIFYHVETPDQTVILANGAPAESFVDAATRASFDNYAEYLALHPDPRGVAPLPYPRAQSARQVPAAIRRRLVA